MSTAGLRSFDGAVAILTGGASGIGAALGQGLAAAGATVVLADRQEEAATELATTIQAAGGHAEAALLDVREAAAVSALVDDVATRHGRLDYLFNNAGIAIGGEARFFQLADWTDVLDVNLRGVVHGVQAAYPRMVRQGFGHIVNTSSMAGLMPLPLAIPYCTAKHAVVGLSRSLRIEGRRYGVRVSVLCPGIIDTPIHVDGGRYGRIKDDLPPSTQDWVRGRLRPMALDAFATVVLRRVRANRALIIAPFRWWVIHLVLRMFPALGDALMSNALKQTLKVVAEHRARQEA